MTCDETRDRLLALPDPRRPTADLRSHLAGCPACAALKASVAGIESAVGRLPVPSGAGAKAAFLARLAEPEPVIARMPTVPRRRGLADLIAGVRWHHAAGLAAGVALTVGGGWLATRPGSEPAVAVAKPRHELLQKEVRHVVRLTNAGSAADRMAIWADVATDLRAEVKDVHQVAYEPDMDALAALFRKAVEDGVVAQARKLPEFMPAKERLDRLAAASKKLADAEAEANALLAVARPQAQTVLKQMATTAREGKETLDKLARRENG